jgi:peroxiredoxin
MRDIGFPALLLLAACASCSQTDGTVSPKSAKGTPGTRAGPAPQPTARPVPPPLKVAAWVNSEPLVLADLKGKVVVVAFWAYFNGPSRTRLMPHLSELHEKHKAEGLVAIGVTEDSKEDTEKFAKDKGIACPLAIDNMVEEKGQTFDAYQVAGMPTVVLVARDGTIAWRGPGGDLTDPMVLAELAKR